MRFPVHNCIQPLIWDAELRTETQDDFEMQNPDNGRGNQICQCRPDEQGKFLSRCYTDKVLKFESSTISQQLKTAVAMSIPYPVEFNKGGKSGEAMEGVCASCTCNI